METVPVYVAIARAIDARNRCIAAPVRMLKDGRDWSDIHQERADDLCKLHLPHGSGFDVGVKLDWDKSTPTRLVFKTSFHHMDENGMYDGWTDHTVIVRASLCYGFDMIFGGRDRNGIKEYGSDLFRQCLTLQVNPYAGVTS